MKKKKSEIQETLVQLVKVNTHKRLWAETLLRMVRAAKTSRGENRNRELAKLEAEITDELNKNYDDRQLLNQTLVIHRDFIVNMKQRHSNLTENDLLLCCFFLMDIPFDTIASLKSISLASLNVARSRLKNKLGISEKQKLNVYLKQMQVN